MSTQTHGTSTNAVIQRICNEFLEMPGLRVTCQQAERLWGLDRATCLDVLESLVNGKFLCRTGRGMYARLTDEHTERPISRT